MGMFDTIRCEHPLPDPAHQQLEFQTKDLDCFLDRYTITREGRLIRHARNLDPSLPQASGIEWPLHGDIRMYKSVEREGAEREWVEYDVRFTHGRLEWIERAPQARRDAVDDGAADPTRASERARVRYTPPEGEPSIMPSLAGRRLTADEFMAHVPEKLELVDGHIPDEEPLLLLLLASVGLHRAAELVGRETWARAISQGETRSCRPEQE